MSLIRLCIAATIVYALAQTPGAHPPGIRGVWVDGLEILPNVTTVDPRPFTRQIWVTVAGTEKTSMIQVSELVAKEIKFNASAWMLPGEECRYHWRMGPPDKLGDVNRDGLVNLIDVARTKADYCTALSTRPAAAVCDLNRSGGVDEADLEIVQGQIALQP